MQLDARTRELFVETIEPYADKAKSLTRAAFLELYPHCFLIKHAKARASAFTKLPSFGFATIQIALQVDPLADVMQVAPIQKRPKNPFPDRMTIGRATNCDVVLRLPFISKVHAHLLLLPDGSFSLRDNNGANGTSHNGRKLEVGAVSAVALGDILGFGSLALELANAGRLYDVLRTPAP